MSDPRRLLHQLETEADLEDCLSAPSSADIACCRRLAGDVLVLGAAGKMGPSLARRIGRSMEAAGQHHRVIAASRFSTPAMRDALERDGIRTVAVDLLDPPSVDALPDCPSVLFLAGRKFGSSGNTSLTWAINTIAPANVARRFARSRIVVFSTGNVYPFVTVSSRGSVESDAPAPRGEYAQSCLGRERVFEHYAREHGTATLIFRLNYAVDLRYGVLVDIARAVQAGRPVDTTISHFNAIWQGDANSYALRALEGGASPPRVLNVTGPETLSVTEVAEFFARRFGTRPRFEGRPLGDALLSDARACHEWLGPPAVSAAELMEAAACWLERGGRTLDKPTHFEVADGKF
jgi:nucleoside-diphosphate-sugar epimerase